MKFLTVWGPYFEYVGIRKEDLFCLLEFVRSFLKAISSSDMGLGRIHTTIYMPFSRGGRRKTDIGISATESQGRKSKTTTKFSLPKLYSSFFSNPKSEITEAEPLTNLKHSLFNEQKTTDIVKVDINMTSSSELQEPFGAISESYYHHHLCRIIMMLMIT